MDSWLGENIDLSQISLPELDVFPLGQISMNDFELENFLTSPDSDVSDVLKTEAVELLGARGHSPVPSPSATDISSPVSMPPTPGHLLSEDMEGQDMYVTGDGSLVFRDTSLVDSQVEELLTAVAGQTEYANCPGVMGTQTGLEFPEVHSTTDANEDIKPDVTCSTSTNLARVRKIKSVRSVPYRVCDGRKTSQDVDDDTLVKLGVKELNRLVQGRSRNDVQTLKQRRRTLKNRGYAANSRQKRQLSKAELEQENQLLTEQVEALKEETRSIQREMENLKQELSFVKAERDNHRREREALTNRVLQLDGIDRIV